MSDTMIKWSHGENAAASPHQSVNLSSKREVVLEEIVSTLASLQLDKLPPHWVHQIWDMQFSGECPAMELVEEPVSSWCALLGRATDMLIAWLKLHKDDLGSVHRDTAGHVSINHDADIWTSFIERGIRHQPLIALLFYHIDKSHKVAATAADRDLGLKATSLYFALLGISGSGAFNIFHPIMFNKALDTFKLAFKLHSSNVSQKKGKVRHVSKSQQPSSRARRRHASHNSSTSSSSQMEGADSEDEADSVAGALNSVQDVQELTVGLTNLLMTFLVFLDHGSLRRCHECLEVTVEQLVNLAHLDIVSPNVDMVSNVRRNGVSAIAHNAYVGLEKLCQQRHGTINSTVGLIFRFLLPGILMLPSRGSCSLEVSNKGLHMIREHSIHFVKHLMAILGDASHEAISTLIQGCSVKVPDKAEFRSKASQAIITLMVGLPNEAFLKITRWFCLLAHDEKPSHRLFAIEVMGKILSSKTQPTEGQELETKETDHDYDANGDTASAAFFEANALQDGDTSYLISLYKFLFGVILSRCRDVAAMVRTRALHTLSEFLSSTNNAVVSQILKSMLDYKGNDVPNPSDPKKRVVETSEFLAVLQDPDSDLTKLNLLPSAEDFVAFMRKKALDDSAFVRKGALQVIGSILKYAPTVGGAWDLVGILAEHCRDASSMVRKQMVTSLNELIAMHPESDGVVAKWVDGLFPLILDVDSKVAEKVVECIWTCLFSNLVSYSQTTLSSHFLPWKILKETVRMKLTCYLSRACAEWARSGQLENKYLIVLKTHIHTENGHLAWLLLALISSHVPIRDTQFVMDYFNSSVHAQEGIELYRLLQVLRVLLASVSMLSIEQRKSLQQDLVTMVKEFMVPPELTSAAVDICSKVSWMEAGGKVDSQHQHSGRRSSVVSHEQTPDGFSIKQYDAKIEAWAVSIIETIDNDLRQKLFKPVTDSKDVETTRFYRQIFTLGELAQICPHRITERLFLMLHSLIIERKSKPGALAKDNYASTPMDIDMGPGKSQNARSACMFVASSKLQALCIVTLAKMCNQNEEMAKKIVPSFGHILSTSEDDAIKNNIMYALTDMCVRYASLVDPLLPQMTFCLKDPSLIVRRTTLTTLIQLLQEDYLKLNGLLFLRIIQTLVDPMDEIRNLSLFYIQHRLLKRMPKVMSAHIVEALFHFNDYQDHQSFNKFVVTEKEKALFSLGGSSAAHRAERLKLYKFMLENMNDTHRLETTYRLCQDILKGFTDASAQIKKESAFELLRDTLLCLACDEIKLVSLKSKPEDDIPGVDEELLEEAAHPVSSPGKAIKAIIVRTTFSTAVKKNAIEFIIPIVIALKHKLESDKSPLLYYLMIYVRDLMKDYKTELKDILSADKNLAAEIQFDLKKWDEQEQNRIEHHSYAASSGDTLTSAKKVPHRLNGSPTAIGDQISKSQLSCRKNSASTHHVDPSESAHPVQDSLQSSLQVSFGSKASSPTSPPHEPPPAAVAQVVQDADLDAEKSCLHPAHNRAISTPSKNWTSLDNHVTFMNRSHDLSSIAVLSPRSAKFDARDCQEGTVVQNESSVAFRFGPQSNKDSNLFDDLIQQQQPPKKKRQC